MITTAAAGLGRYREASRTNASAAAAQGSYTVSDTW